MTKTRTKGFQQWVAAGAWALALQMSCLPIWGGQSYPFPDRHPALETPLEWHAEGLEQRRFSANAGWGKRID